MRVKNYVLLDSYILIHFSYVVRAFVCKDGALPSHCLSSYLLHLQHFIMIRFTEGYHEPNYRIMVYSGSRPFNYLILYKVMHLESDLYYLSTA